MTTTRNTLPTTPGAILGYRSNGLPIRLMAGGAPDSDGTGDGGDGGAGDAAGQSGAGDANGGSGTNDAGQSGSGQQSAASDAAKDGDVAALPAWAQKALTDARADAGKARTTAKQQAADEAVAKVTDDIARALGLKKDEKPDPAKLAEQVTAATAAARAAQVELAVFRNSGKHTADPAALLDSRSFLNTLADLDPTAKDFDSKVTAAIETAVKNNPKLKAAQAAAGSSSVDHAGGSGEQRDRSKSVSLDQAVAGHYGTATR